VSPLPESQGTGVRGVAYICNQTQELNLGPDNVTPAIITRYTGCAKTEQYLYFIKNFKSHFFVYTFLHLLSLVPINLHWGHDVG
jgi:hypothetical protein